MPPVTLRIVFPPLMFSAFLLAKLRTREAHSCFLLPVFFPLIFVSRCALLPPFPFSMATGLSRSNFQGATQRRGAWRRGWQVKINMRTAAACGTMRVGRLGMPQPILRRPCRRLRQRHPASAIRATGLRIWLQFIGTCATRLGFPFRFRAGPGGGLCGFELARQLHKPGEVR